MLSGVPLISDHQHSVPSESHIESFQACCSSNSIPMTHHRQLLVDRDVDGVPFAFVPLLCRLYTLREDEVPEGLRHEKRHAIMDIGALPSLALEFEKEVASAGLAALHRRHTPGIALIVTQSCNLRCSYCLAKQGTFGVDVSRMKISDVLRRLQSLFEHQPDIDFIKFFGGEPTLRIDLIASVCDFVTHKLKRNVHFALTTNGTQLAERHLVLLR